MNSGSKRYRITATSWIIGLQALLFVSLIPAPAPAALGSTYYVSPAGNDANSGKAPDQAWRTVGRVNAVVFAPGDSILFERGGSWDEDLTLNDAGTASDPITVSAYGAGSPPVIRRLTAAGDFTVYDGITVDHQGIASDAVRIQARNVTLRNMIIRNGGSDGVDASDADGLLIEDTLIHHFLAGSFTNQVDAHGVVATDIQGLTIRRTEIHHVSGDSFQADPSRSPNVPMDILIEDSYFWTGPLDADFNSWNAGEVPGENAIDTKVADSDWDSVERATFTIRNLTAHGWINDGFISNRAVFNMKEKIEAVFDGVTVYDAEIAFRLRGTRGNANNTLINVVVYEVEKAIRAEDDLQNLKVYHSTFGSGIGQLIQIAGGGGGVGTWDFRNNAFLDSAPPAQAPDPSNRDAPMSEFVNPAVHNYRLQPDSGLIDSGAPLPVVTADRDGNLRPQGGGYDIGAYEFSASLWLTAAPANQRLHLNWTLNAILPVTATWTLTYLGPTGDQPSPITGLPEPTRAYTFTGLTNYTNYTVTLNAMVTASPVLTATVTAIPTDWLIFLPAVTRGP